MTGKTAGWKMKRGRGEEGNGGERRAPRPGPSFSPLTVHPRRGERGFTLLELMIVISILVILAMIAVAQYNKTVLAAKEATLRENIYQMNKLIDQYGADKGKLPQSLEDLVSAGYLQEIPVDPITEQRDWQLEFGEDPGSTDGSQGVVRVRSAASDLSSDGQTRYNEW